MPPATTVTSGGGDGHLRVKLDSFGGKFDATVPNFAKYNVRLKACIRNNLCSDAFDLPSDALRELHNKEVSDRSAGDKKLVLQCTALYTILVSTIDAETQSGEDLLIYLDSNFEREATGLDFDDGVGAYRHIKSKFGGVHQTSTTNLLTDVKDIRLSGNSPEEVQSFLTAFSDAYARLKRGGEDVSNEQRKANLLGGLGARPEWSAFRVQVQQDDLKKKQDYESVLQLFEELAPIVHNEQVKETATSGAVYISNHSQP
jgi:hypothetical protein